MAKKNETSKSVATKASKVLKDPKATKDAKSIAASALKQSPRGTKAKPRPSPTSAVDKPSEAKEAKWVPQVGQMFTKEGSGTIFEIESFEPLTVVHHLLVEGCHITEPVSLNMDDDFRPVTREEEIALLY